MSSLKNAKEKSPLLLVRGNRKTHATRFQLLIPYIVTTLRDNDLAIKVAGRLNLPGAECKYQCSPFCYVS